MAFSVRGNRLFHVACQNGNKRICKLARDLDEAVMRLVLVLSSWNQAQAIKYGGDMDAQNLKGKQPKSRERAMLFMTQFFAVQGNTGLHFLFAYGYADIAEYFIEKALHETAVV